MEAAQQVGPASSHDLSGRGAAAGDVRSVERRRQDTHDALCSRQVPGDNREAREVGNSLGDREADERRWEISRGLIHCRGAHMLLSLEDNQRIPALKDQVVVVELGRIEAEVGKAAAGARYLEEVDDVRNDHCKARALDSTPESAVASLSPEEGEDSCVTEESRLAACGG